MISNQQPGLQSLDLEKLKLSQNYAETLNVRKALTTVPVRKPNKQDFVRVHPDSEYQIQTMVLELKDDRETFMVAQHLWSELPSELVPKILCTTINRQGVLTLWPIRLPGEDGKLDEWNSSALKGVVMAQNCWIRVSSNMSLGAYEFFEALGDLPEPDWPDVSFEEIINVAFRGNYIDSLDHPAIQKLRGFM